MSNSSNLESRIYESLIKGFDFEESGEIEKSIEAFTIAAKLGSIDALSKLGTIMDDVLKPPQPKQAVYWYKRAVRAGSSSCAWNLAMHYNGLGDRRWYLYWLRVAARMREADAIEELKTGKWWSKRNAR